MKPGPGRDGRDTGTMRRLEPGRYVEVLRADGARPGAVAVLPWRWFGLGDDTVTFGGDPALIAQLKAPLSLATG